jgi:excisionase family DNA binding protein
MTDERLLSPEEVGERLGISPLTVVRWLRAGKLRGHKLGRKVWRMRASDLETFLQAPTLRLVEPEPAARPEGED